MPRSLYLVAYDISHPRRLARALKIVRAYAKPRTLGIARPPADPSFFFVG